jgi:hypothetical protein
LTIIDENQDKLDELKNMCEKNPEISSHMNNNRIKFIRCDYDDMSSVCKQSTFDAIIDYGAIDSILHLSDGDNTKALKCIDHLQNAVRLGNILVCLSKLEKEVFCKPFNERFGWVQELDGYYNHDKNKNNNNTNNNNNNNLIKIILFLYCL